MRKAAIIIFESPDGIVFNLKDDTHRHPHAVAAFGGAIEEGETAREAIVREIEEETSLNPDDLEIKPFKTYHIGDKIFHLFSATLPDSNFKVYEGAGAFVLEPNTDLTTINFPPKTRQIVMDYMKARN